MRPAYQHKDMLEVEQLVLNCSWIYVQTPPFSSTKENIRSYNNSTFFDQCHQATVGDTRTTAINTSWMTDYERRSNLSLKELKTVYVLYMVSESLSPSMTNEKMLKFIFKMDFLENSSVTLMLP